MNRLITGILLVFFAVLFVHNAWLYSPWGGYDKDLHMAYAKILTFEHRIPVYEETPESYNPPLFYWLSGQLAKNTSPWFNHDFLESLKSWQILMALLVPLAGWFWLDTFRRFNPENKFYSWFFIAWLLSLPVLNKMIPMYNLEVPQFISASFLIWFFLKFVLPKPSLTKMVWLGIFSGGVLSLRLMSFTLLLAMGLTMIIAAYVKNTGFKTMIKHNLVFTVIALLIGGQYYFFYRDNGAFGDKMEDLKHIPLWQRQPKTFYTDTFFRTMMRVPVRPNFPNRFIPIFYSDFWGDYWNYFPQQRFGLTINQLRKDRQLITPERINRLAWQNRVNIIPTIIILLGFFRALVFAVKRLYRRRPLPQKQLAEIFLTLFFTVTFAAFFYMNHKFANLYKGDTIKASYLLYAIPVLIYFAVDWLGQLEKRRLIFYPLMTAILIAMVFNLEFIFF